MITILTTIFFVFGLIIGSFLNVVILRFNTERSFGGRSACMSCQNKLTWYELIPIFSFLGLKGRCRTCQTKISITYPLVELVTGLIFATLFLKFQDIFFLNTFIFNFTYAYYAAVFSLLVVIAVYDLRHKIIPDALSLILGLLGFIGLFFFNNSGFYPHLPSILEFSSGLLIAIPFALFWLVSSGTWMGLGDAKLAIGLGWLLGLSRALSGVVIAFWIGAIVGLSLVIFSKKHGMKSEIPFAPYLILGTLLAFLFELYLF
jgi:prepilin signal peptidase PulO-like enzyme (type II secretory pathway)